MICSKCGTEVIESAKFCTSCGNRVDNIVVCPVCETENDKSFTFCFVCGNRLDGKRICKNCNTEILEDYAFCPKCGEHFSNQTKQEKFTKEIVSIKNTKNRTSCEKIKTPKPMVREKGFLGIEKILTPSLLLFGLLFLVLSSLFMGIRVKMGGMSDNSLNQIFDLFGVRTDVFYFFGDAYKEATSAYPEMSFANVFLSQKLSIIIQTVVYACNILLSTIMLILGVVKYCSGFIKREEIVLGKYFAWSVAGYFLSLGLMISNGFYVKFAYSFDVANVAIVLKTVPNVFTWFSIIIIALVGVGAFVLNLVVNALKEFNIRVLVKKVLVFASLIFSVVALVSICRSYFTLVEYNLDGVVMDIGFGAIFVSTLHGKINLSNLNNYYENLGELLFTSPSKGTHPQTEVLFMLFMMLGIALLLGLAILFATRSSFDKKQRPILSIIFTAIVSIALIVAFVFLSDLYSPLGDLNISGERTIQGPIIELVFTLLALGFSIACICIKQKKQIED